MCFPTILTDNNILGQALLFIMVNYDNISSTTLSFLAYYPATTNQGECGQYSEYNSQEYKNHAAAAVSPLWKKKRTLRQFPPISSK